MDIQLDDDDLPPGSYKTLCQMCTYNLGYLQCVCACSGGDYCSCAQGYFTNCYTGKQIPSGNKRPINNCNGNLTLGECSGNETCPYSGLCS